MYIPLKEKKESHNFILLRENNVVSYTKESLLETAHAFDNQYIWARKCAEIVYDGILKGLTEVKISFKNNNDNIVNGAVIQIDRQNIFKNSAAIYGFDGDGYCLITFYPSSQIIKDKKEIAINSIFDCIVHELGHGNVFWKRIKHNQDINDVPHDYELWQKVITDAKIQANDIVYLFCYALYSTYYNEVQAFVSQTYSATIKKLMELYGNSKNITKKQFIDAIISTNTYKTYKSNIEIAKMLIESLGLRKMLNKKLLTYGINYSPAYILRKCKKIKKISNMALRDAYSNVYQYFYRDFINQGTGKPTTLVGDVVRN